MATTLSWQAASGRLRAELLCTDSVHRNQHSCSFRVNCSSRFPNTQYHTLHRYVLECGCCIVARASNYNVSISLVWMDCLSQRNLLCAQHIVAERYLSPATQKMKGSPPQLFCTQWLLPCCPCLFRVSCSGARGHGGPVGDMFLDHARPWLPPGNWEPLGPPATHTCMTLVGYGKSFLLVGHGRGKSVFLAGLATATARASSL